MIEFDGSDIERLAAELEAAGPRAEERARLVVAKTAEDTVRDAQNDVPVATGHLKSTIGSDPDPDGLGFEAGPTASYGGDVEFGTPAHVIEARNAKALFWPGAGHPVRRVNHPGTAPQPYLLPNFDRRALVAVDAFEQVVADIWGR